VIKITDRYKLDAEEIKRELFSQTDEYRMQFDKVLDDPNLTNKERLKSLEMIWNCSSAIHTFIARKAGIDVRNEDGGMLMDSTTGYFMAKIFDVKQLIKKESIRSVSDSAN